MPFDDFSSLVSKPAGFTRLINWITFVHLLCLKFCVSNLKKALYIQHGQRRVLKSHTVLSPSDVNTFKIEEKNLSLLSVDIFATFCKKTCNWQNRGFLNTEFF